MYPGSMSPRYWTWYSSISVPLWNILLTSQQSLAYHYDVMGGGGVKVGTFSRGWGKSPPPLNAALIGLGY